MLGARFIELCKLNRLDRAERAHNERVILAPSMQKALKGAYGGMTRHLTGSEEQVQLALQNWEPLQEKILRVVGLHDQPWLTPVFAQLANRAHERVFYNGKKKLVYYRGVGIQYFDVKGSNGASLKLAVPEKLSGYFANKVNTYVPYLSDINVSCESVRAFARAASQAGNDPRTHYSNGPLQPVTPRKGDYKAPRQFKLTFGDK